MTAHGWKDASTAEEQIRAWWTKTPNANIAIACNPSNLAVLDIDHGIESQKDAVALLGAMDLGDTYMVRTGRRPEYGLQVYFTGAIPDVGLWKAAGAEGQIKSLGGYVMAAGSVHPSGESYEVVNSGPLAPTPNTVRALKTVSLPVTSGPMGKIPDGAGRHAAITSVAGKLRASGLDGDAIYEALVPINPAMCEVPLSDEDLKYIAHGVAKRYAVPEPEPEILIGGRVATPDTIPEPVDWRTHYHTFDEMESAPELTFLIDGFMHVESITGLAAPAGQRKSLIALNVAHSLCTGEPLFGHFAVAQKPTRVLYLCPEMGMRSFRKRARSIGLMPYVGKTFFCRTMNIEDADNPLGLNDLLPDELDGAVVIVDTAIRFIQGDESKSQDMREFAKTLYRLIPHNGQPGAAAVLVLYHSGKAVVKESDELTLENTLRGSSELGAALTCCWGTKLQEQEDPTASVFKAVSYLKCVKPRDFEDDPKPFETTCDETCKMTYIPNEGVPVLKMRNPNRGNKDGKDEAALAFIKANLDLSGAKLAVRLGEHDVERSADWINKKKAKLKGTGVNLTSA
jgi:putative DNA primase/helicase